MQVRNASPEDINRSSLGRMVGGIALLWLASYAIGIPFKYGLAGALLAISAVLFAEWDQGSRARRARNSRTNLAVRLALCSATNCALLLSSVSYGPPAISFESGLAGMLLAVSTVPCFQLVEDSHMRELHTNLMLMLIGSCRLVKRLHLLLA